jgi:hypothetical protein
VGDALRARALENIPFSAHLPLGSYPQRAFTPLGCHC